MVEMEGFARAERHEDFTWNCMRYRSHITFAILRVKFALENEKERRYFLWKGEHGIGGEG
ncbi:MAG: hypothetical protein A2Y88_10160 [Chloroflexi bacterium RBG_13_48_10]|jgi:hypothetical protein|nr:MAG: hypothetical protein A2Y88_10160 [Chloroflexi bacterium RBG_13_48_10]